MSMSENEARSTENITLNYFFTLAPPLIKGMYFNEVSVFPGSPVIVQLHFKHE